jgi:alpha-tubulin suppressor-like RCC1 family protein
MRRTRRWRALPLGILCLLVTAANAQSTGSIIGWGKQVVVGQASLESLVAVASGADHSLGLDSDGSIVAWGSNEFGQCNVPVPNIDFTAIAAVSAKFQARFKLCFDGVRRS